jgi:hypothetical protein
MYFRLIDHYPDFPEDPLLEINECLICLEIKTYDNFKPINFKTQQIYFKKCECGGMIHQRCLCEWYEVSNSCPICRLHMTKSKSMISIFSVNIANFCGTCVLIVIRLCFVFWLMFALACSYHIYRSYFILKNRNDFEQCDYNRINDLI